VFHHDQGVINGVLSHGIRVLHPKYNAMTTFFTMSRNHLMDYYGMADYYGEQELAEAARHPVFVHYTPAFAGRPWAQGNQQPPRQGGARRGISVQYAAVPAGECGEARTARLSRTDSEKGSVRRMERKRRVLISMPSMHIGGAERSLIGLLESLDRDRYEIDLF